ADAPLGSALRLFHHAGDSIGLRRRAPGRGRIALPRAAPPREAEADRRRLDDLREEATGEALPAHGRRKAPPRRRTHALGAARGGDRRHSALARGGARMSARRERDLDDELKLHFEQSVEEHMARGASREEAERLAHREFGNEAMVRENTRRIW